MKRFVGIIIVVAVAALPLTGSAAPVSFEVDRAHSKVLFKVRDLGISNVTGQFKTFDASIEMDPEDLSTLKARAVIDVASVDTEVETRDKHLRSADFFDAENHPKIEFVSTKAEVVGENEVKLYGGLTIRGVTKPVVLDAVLGGVITDPRGNLRTAFTASGTINRKDFGVSWNQLLDNGGVVVADEIRIEIELEAIKPAAASGR